MNCNQIDSLAVKVTEAVDSVAIKLQVPPEEIMNIVVQHQVDAALYAIIYLLVSIILLKVGTEMINQEDIRFSKTEEILAANFITGVVFGVLGLLGIIASFFSIDDIYTGLFNPRYGAIDQIIKLLK